MKKLPTEYFREKVDVFWRYFARKTFFSCFISFLNFFGNVFMNKYVKWFIYVTFRNKKLFCIQTHIFVYLNLFVFWEKFSFHACLLYNKQNMQILLNFSMFVFSIYDNQGKSWYFLSLKCFSNFFMENIQKSYLKTAEV